MDNSPLETALLAALDLTDAAQEALRDLPFEGSSAHRKAYNFGRRIASSAIFRESDIDELDGLLAPLRAQVEEGWVTEVIVDECCVQGGWTQRRLTPAAEALAARLHPVERLLTALRAVRNQRNAMRIAERFHEADAR